MISYKFRHKFRRPFNFTPIWRCQCGTMTSTLVCVCVCLFFAGDVSGFYEKKNNNDRDFIITSQQNGKSPTKSDIRTINRSNFIKKCTAHINGLHIKKRHQGQFSFTINQPNDKKKLQINYNFIGNIHFGGFILKWTLSA